MILTYLAVTGLNVFKTGVKWSQFPVKTYREIMQFHCYFNDSLMCGVKDSRMKIEGYLCLKTRM